MRLNLTDKQIRRLDAIIRESQPYIKKHGISICNLDDITQENINMLTYALMLANTTYLMAKCYSKNELFVHFTTKRHAENILKNGVNTKLNRDDSDYPGFFSCFKVNSMSRGFKTPTIDTAVLFRYTGEYFTCIRQEDVNSNIGYQIIEDFEGIKDLHIRDYDLFKNDKNNLIVDDFSCKDIVVHHGLPIKTSKRIRGLNYEQLNKVLPRIYEEVVYGIRNDEEEITNIFL